MKLREPNLDWFFEEHPSCQWQMLELILIVAVTLLFAIWLEPYALSYRQSLINLSLPWR